ncbi:PHD-type domain-containing protein [Mycena kentingensis (nom. inval.)]|nr:PHD-type domain-containing protein [Mycena kentingensis (nom. inval.)]
MSDSTSQDWGRVLIAGGTDWAKLGKKNMKPTDEHPDLSEPHILRSLANVKAVSVHASGHGCHAVVIDIDGAAWLIGRNSSCALGQPANVDAVSEHAPKRLLPSDLGASGKFVHAAVGRHHTLLVGSNGELWTAGANSLGQCGHPACPEVPTFRSVAVISKTGVNERVVQATAGLTFSAVITESGKGAPSILPSKCRMLTSLSSTVFTFGSGEKGQLGNGKSGERIIPGNKVAYDVVERPFDVDGFEGKKIVQLSAGQQHCIALDETGLVYVWGYGGYCRLGLGGQVDEMRPKSVPQFASSKESMRGAFVTAGPSNSVVIDRQGMYYMAGKARSGGSPYSQFRILQDIMACKISFAICGGVTHWVLTPDDDDNAPAGQVMTVGWGQSAANSELGLGPDEPKSATKPTKHIPLVGVDVFEIAAGQNTTFFLARPNEKSSDLPRHPVDVNPPETCVQCGVDHGEDEGPEVLECEKCDAPYHLSCLTPPLEFVPEGEWFCADCMENPGASVGLAAQKLEAKTLKRKGEPASPGLQKKKRQ